MRIYEIEELTTFFAQKSESILVDVFVRGNCNEEELGAKLQENQMRNLFHVEFFLLIKKNNMDLGI